MSTAGAFWLAVTAVLVASPAAWFDTSSPPIPRHSSFHQIDYHGRYAGFGEVLRFIERPPSFRGVDEVREPGIQRSWREIPGSRFARPGMTWRGQMMSTMRKVKNVDDYRHRSL
jgi:hypothetical protein